MKKTLVKILTVVFCAVALATTFVVPSFAYTIEDLEAEYNAGWQDGEKQGREDGYEMGYEAGVADGEKNAAEGSAMIEELKEGVYAIFDAPARLINSMLDFDFFGINVAGFVRTILTLVVVGAIVFVLIKLIL